MRKPIPQELISLDPFATTTAGRSVAVLDDDLDGVLDTFACIAQGLGQILHVEGVGMDPGGVKSLVGHESMGTVGGGFTFATDAVDVDVVAHQMRHIDLVGFVGKGCEADLAAAVESGQISPALQKGEPRVKIVVERKGQKIAVEAVEAAKKPLLVIGAGANRNMASKMLGEFVDKTGIPFVTTQMGKGVIDERHEKFLGCAALSAGDFVHRAVEASDCIINVGHDVIEKPPFFMKAGGPTVIHVSTKTAEVDPVYFRRSR